MPSPFRIGTRKGPLHLLIPVRGLKTNRCRAADSTGIMVEGEGDWNARPHGGAKRRVWRKVHLGTDEQTLEVRAVVVTSSDVGDAPMLLELLAQIHADQDIASVTAPPHGLQANRCRGHGRCLRLLIFTQK